MNNLNSKLFIVSIIIIMLILSLIFFNADEIAYIQKSLPITSVKTDKKVVAIACNVYEGSDQIKRMVKVLNKKNIKISFFLGGIWVKNNADCVKLLKNMGQDIQNHGYNHKLPSRISRERNIREIKDAEDIIYKISGVRTYLFEPPSGDYDENTISIVNSLNYKMITWSIDTIDWRKDATGELILERIRKKLHPGGIILIHPKQVTADNFERIINYIESQGYEIKSVPELLKEN
ncbi:polysaccharide deacetylase family protein [Fonticella tunisiensis]|uniref:Peptidoglycan/xylan/chitin deacetylase (PgdA/CDA1 family) n=1 Tax=Fonticella tunisiensis TaxID=1096341 RepID=A0A4R7KUB0_9CLOT|nr:polysaccharide deacetylase family protein [Fonticella tunisiensis]TDT61559.1 peptidoglycan/xylan/chitin deacetylase (PgdA/CDA1 family) [Fonticella tunisiensis]